MSQQLGEVKEKFDYASKWLLMLDSIGAASMSNIAPYHNSGEGYSAATLPFTARSAVRPISHHMLQNEPLVPKSKGSL